MNSSVDPLTNLNFLESFTGNNSEKMRKYISIFLSAAPAEMDGIRKSAEEKNWDALRAGAHSLKPQMTYMGIKSGEELLRKLEEYAGNVSNTEEFPSMIKTLDEIFTKACAELNAYLTKNE
jgi:HPt (histidine-containing phosphotransfer) domain-containing protein